MKRHRVQKRRTLPKLPVRVIGRARAHPKAVGRNGLELVAHVSHEIRAPLVALVGATNVLLEGNLSVDEHSRQLDALSNASKLMLSIVTSVLNRSKAERESVVVNKSLVNPASIAQRAVSLISESACNKGLRLNLVVKADVPGIVLSDPTYLSQILLNFLSNAIKYTDSGEIVLELSLKWHRDQTRGRCLRFEVIDSGIGIDPKDQERVFDRYMQVDATEARGESSIGLGLSICRRLASLLGGSVGVASVINEGSRFWLDLPIAADEPIYLRGASGDTHSVPLRILVADDNEISQIVTTRLLRRDGHDVECVMNGADAVQAVKNGSFDLVFMDMRMPVMDGVEATKRIRMLGGTVRNIPIVALTASSYSKDADACRAAGMNDSFTKPLSGEELRSVVSMWAHQAIAS